MMMRCERRFVRVVAACMAMAMGMARAGLPPLVGDGVADDTAAIQARLDAGTSCVYLPPPKREYLISRTLLIGSETELRLDRFTKVRLADGSNCPMLANRDISAGNRHVAVTGGVWDMNNKGQRHNLAAACWMTPAERREWYTPELEKVQTSLKRPRKFDPNFFSGVCFRLFNVEGLELRNLTVHDPVIYGIQCWKVSDFLFDNIEFDFVDGHPAKGNMDGIHLDGWCHHGRITALRGICFDDLVALNATDGEDSPGHGPISDIDIDGIMCDYCHSAVRLLSRSPEDAIRRVTIRNVHGRFYSYGIGLTYFLHDVKERGVMDDITIADCHLAKSDTPADLWRLFPFAPIEVEYGLDIGELRILRVMRDEDHRAEVPTIRVRKGAVVDRLIVRDCVQKNRTDIPMTFLARQGDVRELVHENTHLVSAPGRNVLSDTAPFTEEKRPAPVDPFIGCAANGHTYPGATMPFGMVQPGPDSGNGGWEHCSGYVRDEMTVCGFSQTHLSGTGCPDLADVLLLPFTGESRAPVGIKDAYTETSRIGYYTVTLTNFGVRAEVTASPRVGWHRWSFPRNALRKVYVDLQYGSVWDVESISRRVKSARLELADDRRSFSGANVVSAWLPNRTVAFKVAFSAPWKNVERLPRKPGEKADRLVFTFAPDERPLVAKAAISTTDEAGAARNLEAEAQDWDFDRAASFAFRAWHRLLHAVDIDAPADVRTSFYTALYHLYTQPNNLADVDGRYRDAAGNVQLSRAPDKSYYSGFSLWDTFRAAHPLYTILVPEKVPAFVESMLAHYRAVGYLPVIPYFGRESFCMIGNHAVPVVVDAALKGFGGFDLEEAFHAVDDSLSRTHVGKPKEDWKLYDALGYYPFDLIKAESVSRTLECGIDDACAARLARRLGRADRVAFYERRAAYYRNLYDARTGFFRARDSQGRWIEPFDPFQVGHEGNRPNPYTEGNAWQYRFHVLHDVPGLMALMGGKEAFTANLDALFEEKGSAVGTDVVRDVSGLVGQYAQGNEQSHHVAYLYTCAGRPDKAAARIGEIFATQYHPTTDGLCGNDDCGQMSAWYVFAALGFYPVDPASGVYVIGAPQVRRATIRLSEGRVLTIKADGFGNPGAFVRSATFNGRPLDGFTIRHGDLMAGGELVLSARRTGE